MSTAITPRISDRAMPRANHARARVPIYYAILTTLVGGILTFGAWYAAFRAEQALIQRETANRASSIEAAIEDRLDAYVSVLEAGAGLFDASDEVTYADWIAFTRRLRESPVYPGVQGVGFAVRVRQAADFERYRYVPVYERGRDVATVDARRERLVGFVYSPFRVEDFLRGVLGRVPSDVSLSIYDGPTPHDDVLLYRTSVASLDPTESRTISLAGHEWLLLVNSTPTLAKALRGDARWIALGGVVATLLSAAGIFALALGRQHARERLRVERALQEGERFAAAVIENSLDAYVSIDCNDRIVGWNKKAEEIFGWSSEEVLGRALSDTIVPAGLRERHVVAVRKCDVGAAKLLGRRIEMPARTRTNAALVVELSILAVQRAEQPIFVASLRDITRQREQDRQLRTLNENLEHAVNERTRALEEANAVLRTTNEQLDAFTRNVSHDLRAPLRAIEGYARLAAEEGESTLTSSSRSHLRAVLRNVERMQSIIDGLLQLAWIGQQPLHAREVDLWKLILDVVNELSADNTFVLRAQPEALQSVWADPGLLEHAIRNLLSNAVKFSRKSQEPTVEVGAHEVEGERRYFVRDNGVGFDAQCSEPLFQVFGRLHRADEFEGTGIGLTIVKSVIERHGGRVWAESESGRGATFWFVLPQPMSRAA